MSATADVALGAALAQGAGVASGQRVTRLVYVHDSPVPSNAANVVQVLKMCRAFGAAGAAVTLLALRAKPGKVSFEKLSEIYGLTPTSKFEVRTAPVAKLPARMVLLGAAAALGVGRDPGAVIYTRSISAAAAAASFGRRVALEMHLPLSAYAARSERLRSLVRKPGFSRLVVITDSLRRDYERELPDLEGRVVVAHDGADPAPAGIVPAQLAGEFKVGYVGHLYPGKGMEIIAKLAGLCPRAVFHIVGGNPSDIERWRLELRAAANVVFHGHVPHATAASYIAAMDVVLAPYLSTVRAVGGQSLADWMSPLKIFEYMAGGKAMVASDLPVIREVLTNGQTAVLCAPADIGAWAAALERLRSDPVARRRIGEDARAMFLERYTWDKRARAILAAIGSADAPART